MSRRARRTRRRKGSGSAGYMIVTAIAVTAIIGLVGFSVHLRQSRVAVDEVTLCPKVPPARAWVLVLDVTDSVNPVQRQSIANQAELLKGRLKAGDRIEVFSIDAGSDLLRSRFTLCRPKGAEEGSAMTENVGKLATTFEEKFEKPLAAVFDELLSAPPATSSPIMRGIQAAVVAGFGALPASTERKLVVISDMLEFEDGRTHYKKEGISTDLFEEAGFARLMADMRGVEAEIWYIRRSVNAGTQGIEHITFWEAYFARQKARLERVVQVEG